MSSPVRHAKDLNAALMYAPPWAREEAHPLQLQPGEAEGAPLAPEEAHVAPEIFAEGRAAPLQPDEPLADVPERSASHIEWPPWSRRGNSVFSGDVAVLEMQRRLALSPERVPLPVALAGERNTMRIIARASVATGVAAAVAWAVVSLPGVQSAVHAIGHADASAPAIAAQGGKQDQLLPAAAPAVRLIVHDERAEANEPLPAGIKLNGNGADATVLLSGLPANTWLSTGNPVGADGWRVAGRDLDRLLIQAPRDFVGVLNVKADLRLGDDRIADSQNVHLEWVRPPEAAKPQTAAAAQSSTSAQTVATASTSRPAIQPARPAVHLDEAEIATLVARGHEFLKNGDFVSARLLLRRAADAGSASAALALGETFDPDVIQRLGAIGVQSDADKSREWYQKAAQLGSDAASQQLAKLAQAHD